MPILHWLNKDEALKKASRAPYRILEADEKFSYGKKDSQNFLIQGDNLEALKALLPYFASKVKCVYIDPPYNTGSAFEHYDDNLEHSKWLEMIYPRLELLRELLTEDGSIWISIDADEAHYLKVICDEIFGRKNFIDEVVWQRSYAPINLKKTLSRSHDTILVYAKSLNGFELNKLPRSEDQKKDYKNPDNDPRGLWKVGNPSVGPAVEKNIYEVTLPSGRVVLPPKGRSWLYSRDRLMELIKDGRIWFGKDGNSIWAPKLFLTEVKQGITPMTWWPYQEVGHNQDAKKEIKELELGEVFGTPKSEKLLHRILTLATNEGDLVLDSFLGSGTTAAVACKMNRRFVGIEIGEHAKTHCAVRLQKVIDGEQGGISKEVNWQGGGGFRFYNLGEAIFDEGGRINQGIRFENLAAHIWFCETKNPLNQKEKSPFLGVHNGVAYYLLFNGILGEKSISGGNVLTKKIFAALPKFSGPKVIYGEVNRLSLSFLEADQITFRQTPYDIKAS
jgi:adenine-specific DNA-methyltransferase